MRSLTYTNLEDEVARSMQEIISSKREEIAALCRTHQVRRLAVFGSAARGIDFNPETSDIDLLVEFHPLPHPESVNNYRNLERALIALLACHVDLIREGTIKNPYIRVAIQNDQETLYAA